MSSQREAFRVLRYGKLLMQKVNVTGSLCHKGKPVLSPMPPLKVMIELPLSGQWPYTSASLPPSWLRSRMRNFPTYWSLRRDLSDGRDDFRPHVVLQRLIGRNTRWKRNCSDGGNYLSEQFLVQRIVPTFPRRYWPVPPDARRTF